MVTITRKPTEGKGLAYIDWSAQEIGIAAALSILLMKGYTSGDPYLAFGKQLGSTTRRN